MVQAVASVATVDRADPPPGVRRPRLSAPSALLVCALAYAGFSQGAFYRPQFLTFAVLLAAAAVLAVRRRPPARPGGVPVVAGAFAVWSVVGAALAGDVGGAGGPVALAGCLAAAVTVVRSVDLPEREQLATGAIVVGAAVAVLGWLGVVLRAVPLALADQELWRAASSITYANGTAGLLAPLAVLAVSRLVHRPADKAAAVAATLLLTGTLATLSRAGYLALAAGLAVLGIRLGPRRTVAAAWGAGAGAVVGLAGLLPTMPARSPARPGPAVLALVAGLVIALVAPRLRPRHVVAGVLAAVLAATAAGAWRPVADAARRIGAVRITTSSPDRAGEWSSTWQQARTRPWTGVGPGNLELVWQAADGRTMRALYTHNEYLQVLAEQGAIGLGLVVALLATALAGLRRGERTGWVGAGALAACVPLLVHSAFDFVWHIPLVPVTGIVILALAGPVPPTRKVPPCSVPR